MGAAGPYGPLPTLIIFTFGDGFFASNVRALLLLGNVGTSERRVLIRGRAIIWVLRSYGDTWSGLLHLMFGVRANVRRSATVDAVLVM